MVRLLVLLLVCAACGARAKPPPPPPAIDIRKEIAEAEKAEKARQHDVARVHYERAVNAAKDPSSVFYARREYAETLITWGEYRLAIEHLEGALTARPDHAPSWHDLGLLRNNQNNIPGAIQALEKSRALAPKDPRPRIALAALRWKHGDKTGATTEYKQLLELELPDRVRAKVEWALRELAKP